MLTEEFADRRNADGGGGGGGDGGELGQKQEKEELRWALTPSVMQRKSSKGDDFGKGAKYQRSVAEKLWSFEFEGNDKGRLRGEHLDRGSGGGGGG